VREGMFTSDGCCFGLSVIVSLLWGAWFVYSAAGAIAVSFEVSSGAAAPRWKLVRNKVRPMIMIKRQFEIKRSGPYLTKAEWQRCHSCGASGRPTNDLFSWACAQIMETDKLVVEDHAKIPRTVRRGSVRVH
jgi:hypothetical protein